MGELRFVSEVSGSLQLRGEMTHVTVTAALRESERHFGSEGGLQIDLKGVKRVDSAGLSLLIEWIRRLEAEDRDIWFTNLPRQLEGIARVSGVYEILAPSSGQE